MEKDPFQNQNNLLPPLTQQEFDSWQPPEGQPTTHSTLELKALDQIFIVRTELPNPLEHTTSPNASVVHESLDSSVATSAHEEQPIETLETNAEDGPVEPLAVTTALVFGGIGRSITALRLRRAENKIEKLKSNDRVIRHAPKEAEILRGFKTGPMSPKDRPISQGEKTAFSHRGNQVAKKRKKAIEQSRLRAVYGEPAPAIEPRIRQSNTGTAAADRWNEAAGKLEKIDRGQVVSFETRGRESAREAWSRQRAQRRNSKADKKVNTIDNRLQRGTQGDTLPGKMRKRRINKKQRKIEKLHQKLGE